MFGYGNYLSSAGNLGFALSKHFSFNAGYTLTSRLLVNDQSNRVGIDLTPNGATCGYAGVLLKHLLVCSFC